MTEPHDLAAPYVLGALDEAESARFEAHLDVCPACRQEVADLQDGLVSLATRHAEHPSGQMRQVVMSSIEPAQVVELRPRRRLLIWIPAVAAVAIVILGLAVFLGGDPVGDVLGADDAVATELAATDSFTGDAPTVARIVYSESQGAAVVEFEGLTPVASDQVYQLWLIDDGVAVPAGLFNPDDRGSALVLISGEPNSGEVVGVTAEPSGGSTAPTGDVLFAAEI